MGRPPVLSGKRCYHCGGAETCRAGMTRGKQRYKCRGCGKFFREDPQLPSGKWDSQERKKYNLPTTSQLILELQAITQNKLGRTPTTNDINNLSKLCRSHSLATYYAVFGSFVTAIRRSKLKQHYMQQFDEVAKTKLLSELRALSKRLKRPIVGKDVMDEIRSTRKMTSEGAGKNTSRKTRRTDQRDVLEMSISPLNHFQRAFGSVPKAIEAAGVGPKLHYTREEMIAILRKLDAKLDRPVEAADIDELFALGKGPSASGMTKKFGSLAKARQAAGIKLSYEKANGRTHYWQKYTREELIAQLTALGKSLGRKPTDRDINRASKRGECASSITFANMFGSLRAAYRASGFVVEEKTQRRWTDKAILSSLRALKCELGRPPGYYDLKRASLNGDCPSPGTVARRFGGLEKARQAAGLG